MLGDILLQDMLWSILWSLDEFVSDSLLNVCLLWALEPVRSVVSSVMLVSGSVLVYSIMFAYHTVTSRMLYGFRPASVCRANSSSLNQKNLSPANTKSTYISTCAFQFFNKYNFWKRENSNSALWPVPWSQMLKCNKPKFKSYPLGLVELPCTYICLYVCLSLKDWECSLAIVSGASNRSTSSLPSLIALKSLGRTVFQIPCFWRGGKLIPSLKSESTALMCGNPISGSTIVFSTVGIRQCINEYTVFAENVSCFISEKHSSLGT